MSNFGLSQNINQFPIDPRAEWVSNGGSSTPNITNDTVGSIFEKEDVVTLNPKHPTSEQQAQIDVDQQFEALRNATEELRRLSRYNPLIENYSTRSTSQLPQQITETQQDSANTKFSAKTTIFSGVPEDESRLIEAFENPTFRRDLEELNNPEKLEKQERVLEEAKRRALEEEKEESRRRLEAGCPRPEDL